MQPVVAAVLGAGIGASATLVASILNARFQAAREATSWERERRQAAYQTATRALLRIRNRRRRMAATGWAEVAKEHLPTFLDDLVEAQYGLSVLLVACGERQRTTLRHAVDQFDGLVEEMLTPPLPAGNRLRTVSDGVQEVWNTVLAAQRDDVGARDQGGGASSSRLQRRSAAKTREGSVPRREFGRSEEQRRAERAGPSR